MTVLVTGGAGYVGSHMLLALKDAGETAVALDDLSVGRKEQIPEGVLLVVANAGDRRRVAEILAEHAIEEVIHFAGSTLVRESIGRPLAYYHNNTANMIALLEACGDAGVRRFIFSSSASVYGMPEYSPVPETAPLRPISPYGASMAMSERVLADAAAALQLSFATLRYFNVAGADPRRRAGEIGRATHLIKVAAQIAVGARKGKLQIYGADYPTPDGTAIRDYVHVSDIAEAHLAALAFLRGGGGPVTLNVGYGRGYSVREVIDAVERVIGRDIKEEASARRAGDPPQLIADCAAIRRVLQWRPHHDDIDYIVRTAIEWETKLMETAEGTAH